MFLAVLMGFLLAAFAPLITRVARGFSGWVLALLPIGLFIYFASYLEPVRSGEDIRQMIEWVPQLGVNLNFRLDGLSLMMALIITGIGTLIFIYGGGYLKGDVLLGRFFAYLSIFMAAMLGLVLSDNILALFVFWELTSISSYLLIGYKHTYEDSRKAALRALVITGAGGLAMLAGFVLLALVSGSSDISGMSADAVRESGLYIGILILICAGAFTKSAQFPFHSWLPGAMAAPTPVSAYLHSATMVKAGVYLLARLSPVLGGTPEWSGLLIIFGLATVLVGGYLAIIQFDLKRILAYSTISSLGVMVTLLGIDTEVAIKSAVLFLLVHSLYKGALFMVAGTIDHETGTRDIRQLGGLLRILPLVFVGGALAALSMMGMIPFIGFIGKELIYEATLDVEHALTTTNAIITALSVLGNMSAVAVACLVIVPPFLGQRKDTPHKPHGAPIALWVGSLLLGALGLAMGIVPELVAKYLISPSASAVNGAPLEAKLYLWHGITPMLILSMITLAGGFAYFALRGRLVPVLARFDRGAQMGPDRVFMGVINGLPDFAKKVTAYTQGGILRHYIAYIMAFLLLFMGTMFFTRVALPPLTQLEDVRIYELILCGVILLALAMLLQAKSLLFAIASMSVIGYSITALFVMYGAPDLAMTQFAIETLSVVLFVLMLYRLPDISIISSRLVRARDAVIAGGFGIVITMIVLSITAVPLDSPLERFFAEKSYVEAQGRNIVNVILVDFRGFDTLGEITVLSVAALGVIALMRLRPRNNDEHED